jgi:hypothetical protein
MYSALVIDVNTERCLRFNQDIAPSVSRKTFLVVDFLSDLSPP